MHIKCLTQFLAYNRCLINQGGDEAEKEDGKMVGVYALPIALCLYVSTHVRECVIWRYLCLETGRVGIWDCGYVECLSVCGVRPLTSGLSLSLRLRT